MDKEQPLSDIKTHLTKIIKAIQKREEEVIITKNGRPAAVLLNYHEFRRLQETVEVLSDQKLMEQIRKSRKFFKKKKPGSSFEEIFEEPLLG